MSLLSLHRLLATAFVLIALSTIPIVPSAEPALATTTPVGEYRASGSASEPNNLIGIEARLSEAAVRENASLGYDLGRKALLYSNFAIRELWVIDAVKLETHIHRRPGREGYEDKTVVASDQTLTPGFAPELAVRLAELQLV